MMLSPSAAMALAEEGLRLQSEGNSTAAIPLYRQAESALSSVPELHNNLAACYQATGQFSLAAASARQALQLRPDYGEACNNLGNALQALGQSGPAEEQYRRALAIDPASANAWFNLGTLLLGQETLESLEEAEKVLEHATVLQPASVKAYRNLGLARMERGRLAEALIAYDEACRLAPQEPETLCNRALLRLLSGDWERGWAEYEIRQSLPDYVAPAYAMPRWNGEDLQGKGLLLWTEQGVGTSIQFSRYIPLLAARGAIVSVSCSRSLQRLLEAVPGVEQVVAWGEVPPCDYHLPLISAPYYFRTRLGSVPAPTAFRIAPLALPAPKPLPRIGVVWAGNPQHANDSRRSFSPSLFGPLAERTQFEWVSLQNGPGVARLSEWPGPTPLHDGGSDLTDFYETAQALQEVDLVVSVDTAVAHLAASLGKPVALLLPFAPDWRWMTERIDSPWYPSMRLFRQTIPGRWEEPIAALARTLDSRLSSWTGS